MTALPRKHPNQQTPRGLWRTRKASFLVAGCIVMVAGLYLALVAAPNVYEAKAVLVVRSGGGASILPGGKFISELTSTAVLTSVAEVMGKLSADAPPTTRQAVVRRLRDNLTVVVQPMPGEETEIRVSSRGHNREELAGLVRLTTETYVARCKERNGTRTGEVGKLRSELKLLAGDFQHVAGQLSAANAALAAFRTENAALLGEVAGDPDTALRRLIEEQRSAAAELEKVQADKAGLEASEKFLRTRLKNVTPFVETREVTTVRDPERVALEREIRMMQRQLEEMLRTYTFKHPEVIAHRTNLLLKKRQLRKLKKRVEDRVKSSRKQNPEYAMLKGKLDDTVVKLQIARSSLGRLTGKPEALVKKAGALRALVDSHRKLTERLTQTQERHTARQTALKEKEKALEAAERTLEPVPEINTPATTPTTPTGPRRSLYLLGVLIASLLVGRMAMSAAFRLSRGFASEYELSQITGLPVAAGVSAVAGTESERRERLKKRVKLGFLLGFLAAVAVLVFTILAHYAQLS